MTVSDASTPARIRYFRGGDDESSVADLYSDYRLAVKALKRQVAKANAKAWEELLETIGRDP